MSSEDAKKAIDAWVSKRAHEITLKAQLDMDEIALCAKVNLSAEIDGLKAQAEAFDSALPFNLIDIITKGGFVKAEMFEAPYDNTSLGVTFADSRLFLRDGYDNLRFDKGRYKVVLIVEKLEEEE